jgi:ATP-dependent DNA ligase
MGRLFPSRACGWSDPEGSRPYVGTLLLGYFEPNGQLIYAGRVCTGISQRTLATLHKRLQPLAIKKIPLVAEITYLSWPDDGLLRHTVFVGLREDKPAREVRREREREAGLE